MSACAGSRPARSSTRSRDHGVTHLCGAPIVMNMLINAPRRGSAGRSTTQVEMMTAAAPPPAAVIERMERMGFHITHVYGLTEVYGPAVVCAWHDEWDGLPPGEQARLKARQGVRYPVLEGLMVADPQTLAPVPPDGADDGRGLHARQHRHEGLSEEPDGDRGGLRRRLVPHRRSRRAATPTAMSSSRTARRTSSSPAARTSRRSRSRACSTATRRCSRPRSSRAPTRQWGETPCAFVTLQGRRRRRPPQEIIAFCRGDLARFKVPRTVVFGPLPKTSTGKVQKFVLRDQARAL